MTALSPQLVDSLGKVGAIGALLLTFGLFIWAFFKGGNIIRDAIQAADLARSGDHREELIVLRELVANVGKLTETVARLTVQVEELRRNHHPRSS